jgi:hypothetical protein
MRQIRKAFGRGLPGVHGDPEEDGKPVLFFAVSR